MSDQQITDYVTLFFGMYGAVKMVDYVIDGKLFTHLRMLFRWLRHA